MDDLQPGRSKRRADVVLPRREDAAADERRIRPHELRHNGRKPDDDIRHDVGAEFGIGVKEVKDYDIDEEFFAKL